MRALSALKSLVPRWKATAEAYDVVMTTEALAPASESDAVLDWPEDPDEVPAWVIKAEQLRAALGIADRLPARTKREFWAAVDLCEITAAGKVAPEPKQEAPLPTSEAARRFLSSIQHDEEVGEYTAPELSALYSDFCARHGLTPSPVDHVKAELALLPGVHRQQVSRINPATNKRQRNWLWIIKPLCDMTDEEIADNYVDPDELRLAA